MSLQSDLDNTRDGNRVGSTILATNSANNSQSTIEIAKSIDETSAKNHKIGQAAADTKVNSDKKSSNRNCSVIESVGDTVVAEGDSTNSSSSSSPVANDRVFKPVARNISKPNLPNLNQGRKLNAPPTIGPLSSPPNVPLFVNRFPNTHPTYLPAHIRNIPISKAQSLDLADSEMPSVLLTTKQTSFEQNRPIYPNVPYSPYGSPFGSPRNRRRPLRESRRISIEQSGSFLQLNQYKLLDQIGQVRRQFEEASKRLKISCAFVKNLLFS